METLRTIDEFEHLKILADARRLAILRLLMAAPATLSQLGQTLGEHPARVRHHLKLLEKAGLVELVDTRVVRGFTEKYYRARARAFLLRQMVLPGNGEGGIVVMGSHDLALEILAAQMRQSKSRPSNMVILPVGSLDGLIALRQGIAQVAGCHLLDIESGEYNLPFIRRLFPDRPVRLVTLAHRQQGLLVAQGNPRQIHSLEDLARPEVSLINRNRGSGTRLWLDRQLESLGLPPPMLRGYEREARTHTALAEAIVVGKADAGLGILAVAQKYELDFIPLFQERFDLAVAEDWLENVRMKTLFDLLTSARLRRLVQGLGGYQTEHMGDQLL
jgi:putative molybdopterin biosynthesis protein